MQTFKATVTRPDLSGGFETTIVAASYEDALTELRSYLDKWAIIARCEPIDDQPTARTA